jgi:diacylglycerol kinase (ATP)
MKPSVTLTRIMRAAAILGLNSPLKILRTFQAVPGTEWSMGCPESAEQADVILILGGDGTVHRYLPTLFELKLPVLVIPCGSGNDFAQSLGLGNIQDSRSAWQEFVAGSHTIRAIDLIVVKELASGCQHYVCCAGGIGLDAEAARFANALPRWLRAHGGYAISVLPALFRYRPQPMKILWTGEDQKPPDGKKRLLCVAFANSPAYGGGMKIAPRAQMDDGKLDVCIVSDMPMLQFLRVFPSVYFGRHLRDRHVQYLQTTCLRIEPEFSLGVYGDGEYLCQTPIEISVIKGALRVIEPPKKLANTVVTREA